MKNIILTFIFFPLILSSCKTKTEKQPVYTSFGKEISISGGISNTEMAKQFDDLKVGDTLNIKFNSTIDAVCQKKGCWIKVPLNNEKKSFVKFKDYAFFMPLNSAGSKVVLNGKAFKNEISVKQLQHYAKDAGKSDEEIAKITKPKITYSFLADGVLLEHKNDEN